MLGGDVNSMEGQKGEFFGHLDSRVLSSASLFPAEIPLVGSEGEHRVEETPGQGSFPAASPRKQV